MTASMKFDQSGLPAGVADQSRSDIVAGTAVAITNVSPGTINTLELLWRPPEDDTVAISGSSPSWSLTPKAGTYGTYRLKLTVDGEESIRTFAVRSPNRSLVIPAPNERADPAADLLNVTAETILSSETNEPFDPFTTGSPFGWWKALAAAIRAIDDAPTARQIKTQQIAYTDTTNKVIGPLSEIPIVTEVTLAPLTGTFQEYGEDFTVRQVTGGSAPGYYICVATGSSAPGGGSFVGGSNPSTGIDSILISGDKVQAIYPIA